MKKISLFLFGLMLFSTILSCSKEKDLDAELFGRWDVTKVEGQQKVNGVNGIYLQDNNPTGYVEFNDNGSGVQNYSFSLLGTTYPQNANFTWTATDSEISINRLSEPDLIWERKVSESNKQVASYNIVVNTITIIEYTLTLEK